jgi:hypothetical protein
VAIRRITFVRGNLSWRAISDAVRTGAERLKQLSARSAFVTVFDVSDMDSPAAMLDPVLGQIVHLQSLFSSFGEAATCSRRNFSHGKPALALPHIDETRAPSLTPI